MIQLEDGSVFGLQGPTVNSVLLARGLFRANGRYASGAFTPDQPAKVFSYYGGFTTGTLSASYTPAGSFSWTWVSHVGTIQWNSTRLSSQTYDYDHAASLADVAGNWMGSSWTGSATGNVTTLVVSPTGEMTGGELYGCRFSGVASPRPGGKNVFNVSVTFENNGAACDNPAMTVTGVGVILQTNSTTRQFLFGAHDAGGSEGLVWTGSR
jgi:hypothetical protein